MTRPLLPRHNRYDFVPLNERKNYDWPGGKRLAFVFTTNVECFAFGAGLGHDPAKVGEPQTHRNYSWRDYGNRIGIWRLFELLDELKMPAAHNTNSLIYDYAPQVMDEIRRRGDEIVGHGHTNAERQADMDLETEAEMIALVTARLHAEEGKAPRGWMGPWVNETHHTPELLKRNGYTYVMDWMMDDQPITLRTDDGPLIALPYARPTNDITALHRSRWTPAHWVDTLIDQVQEMLLQSLRQPLVFNLSLHPYLMHAFRLKHLRRFFNYLDSVRDQIWIARTGDIAQHVESLRL